MLYTIISYNFTMIYYNIQCFALRCGLHGGMSFQRKDTTW